MKIHRLEQAPDDRLARSLADFEKEFRYPLGSGRSFSICHGDDYTKFFRSMGEAVVYLAEQSGNIVGSLVVVKRTAVLADGSMVRSAYLCDSKVAAAHRGRMVLGRLALQVARDLAMARISSAYSVVMSGSVPTDTLTGRLGIPLFHAIGRLEILRFDTSAGYFADDDRTRSTVGKFLRFRGGTPGLASIITPTTVQVDGASGLLMDTRAGKRLLDSQGEEIHSAHLCSMEFGSIHALVRLIGKAIETARGLGFPALFVALPADAGLAEPIARPAATPPTIASATVFGTGLPAGAWWVDTMEI